MNKLILGIGNKARQGKDTFANIWNIEFPNDTLIIHWADALKEEVSNKERKTPLIYRIVSRSTKAYFYFLLDQAFPRKYLVYTEDEVPYLHEIFEKRKIESYEGMDEKDPEILQFWGTNFRREQDPDYWVKATLPHITSSSCKYVLIPDTRFKNEYDTIKQLGGKYLKVVRRTKDGQIWIDPQRDPNHKSEIDLDSAYSDYAIVGFDGDLIGFTKSALTLMYDQILKKGSE